MIVFNDLTTLAIRGPGRKQVVSQEVVTLGPGRCLSGELGVLRHLNTAVIGEYGQLIGVVIVGHQTGVIRSVLERLPVAAVFLFDRQQPVRRVVLVDDAPFAGLGYALRHITGDVVGNPSLEHMVVGLVIGENIMAMGGNRRVVGRHAGGRHARPVAVTIVDVLLL